MNHKWRPGRYEPANLFRGQNAKANDELSIDGSSYSGSWCARLFLGVILTVLACLLNLWTC